MRTQGRKELSSRRAGAEGVSGAIVKKFWCRTQFQIKGGKLVRRRDILHVLGKR